jgi:NitT/TauT family transport system substrate-binding protein
MRKLLAAAVLAAFAASPLFTAPAQAQTAIKIMVGGIDKQIYLPAKLAAQLGFFKEQGLDVELFNSTSGSQAATALLAREVQGVVGFYDHTIDLRSRRHHLGSAVRRGARRNGCW